MRHLLIQAIEPRLSLRQWLAAWHRISLCLREAPRRRAIYRAPDFPTPDAKSLS